MVFQLGQVGRAVGERVDDEAHGGPRRVDVGPPGDVLLQDVVLDGAADLLARHALLLGHQLVEEQQDGAGGVDRHGRRDLVHREVGHEETHVGQRVDGDADLAHLALGPGVVGVVAHLGRQVEGAREPGLAGVEEELEALVGLLGRAEAGVLAHGPQLRAVHLGVDAPGVGEGPRLAQLRVGSQPVEVLRPVDGLDRDARVGQALGAGLGVLLLRCHGHEPTEDRGGRATRGRLRRVDDAPDPSSRTSASA